MTAAEVRRTIGVAVDGRTVGTVDVPQGASEGDAARAALLLPLVRRRLAGRDVEVASYRPDRMIGLASKAASGARGS